MLVSRDGFPVVCHVTSHPPTLGSVPTGLSPVSRAVPLNKEAGASLSLMSSMTLHVMSDANALPTLLGRSFYGASSWYPLPVLGLSEDI